MIGPSLDYLEYQYDLANTNASDDPEDDGLEVYDCMLCFKSESECRCNAEEERKAAA
jgi:hypothetical protein